VKREVRNVGHIIKYFVCNKFQLFMIFFKSCVAIFVIQFRITTIYHKDWVTCPFAI